MDSSSGERDFISRWQEVKRRQSIVNQNSGKDSKLSIKTYNKMTRSPTKDLQRLVLALVLENVNKELHQLDSSISDRSSHDVAKMRLHSFLLNAQELVKLSRVTMLEEAARVVEAIFGQEEMDYTLPEANMDTAFPSPVCPKALQCMPADKVEIQKTEVANLCIAAQRGQEQLHDESEFPIFETPYLDPAEAAKQTDQTFAKICTAYQAVLQKMVEVNYIEKRSDTNEAVSKYMTMMQKSEHKLMDSSLDRLLYDASSSSPTFVYNLVSEIMDAMFSLHSNENFQPLDVDVSVIAD